MADPVTLECVAPACVSGEDGARYKTPPLPPDVAVQLLALHDRRVHGAAVDQGRHQSGTGGADVHPPDTAAWPMCDDSEPKTTSHSSDTMRQHSLSLISSAYLLGAVCFANKPFENATFVNKILPKIPYF